MRFDALSEYLVVFIFCEGELDINALFEQIRRRQDQTHSCPLIFLPTLLEVWGMSVEAWRKVLDQLLVTLERSTGMTSIATMKCLEAQPHEYETLTWELHALNTDLIFLSNVVQFEVELGNMCEKAVHTMGEQRKLHHEDVSPVDKNGPVLQQFKYSANDTKFRQIQLHSLRMRVQSQINLVCI